MFDWNVEWDYREEMSNPEDRGRVGKIAEEVVRQWLRRNAVWAASVEHVTPQGKADGNINRTVDGKRRRTTYEIKTACGELDNVDKAQYIMYCIEVVPGADLSQLFHVFTREQFHAMLAGYPGRGKLLKTNSKRGTVHIQSFRSAGRPKASLPIREYLDSVCATMPTLAEWETMFESGKV